MIPRTLAKTLRRAARKFPVVTVTGPRQSGKTTLVRETFKDYHYLSLELPDQREFALTDPRGFLAQFSGPAILDEVQRAPELFSYLQVMVDEQDRAGQFILTGSQNFLLLQTISQTLAGRTAVLQLLPFSLSELSGRRPVSMSAFGRRPPGNLNWSGPNLEQVLFTGFYPRIHDKKIPPRDWLDGYYQTYLERDVRSVLNIGDLESFGRFLRLCAGRNAQLLNLSGLAADAGVSQPTARRWLSVMEASFIVTLLRPHHRNFGKRMIKSPKLYFLDTGLLCYLLQVQRPEDLHHHALRGSIFESLVLSELQKNFLHRGEPAPLYFFRDAAGREVDFLIDLGQNLIPAEAKSARTLAEDFFKGIKSWQELAGAKGGPAALIYGGDQAVVRSGVTVRPWFSL